MKISKKISLLIIGICSVFFIVGIAGLTWQLNKTEVEVYKKVEKRLKAELKTAEAEKFNIGITNAVSIANDSRLRDALSKKDRKEAIKSLKKIAKSMKKHTSLKNVKVHVHTKDNKSFVRSWKLNKHGDKLSKFRASVVKVNKKKKSVNTYELGKVGLSIRSVIPVMDSKDKHVGSLEFMQGLNSVAKSFNKRQDGYLVLMDKRKSKTKTFSKKQIFKENYVISQKFLRKGLLEDAETIDMKELLKTKRYVTEGYLYTYKKIKDFAGKELGITIISSPMSKVNLEVSTAQFLIEIFAWIMIALVVIAGGATILLINFMVTKPLEKFETGLQGFFKYLNRESDSAELLDDSKGDEIGTMARQVNKNIGIAEERIEDDDNMINRVKETVNIISSGDLTTRVKADSSNDTLNDLKDLINEMLNVFNKSIGLDVNDITRVLKDYREKDFTSEIKDTSGEISASINDLGLMIQGMLFKNQNNSEILSDSSNELKVTIADLTQSTNKQAANLEEVAASIEEISGNIRNSGEKTGEMSITSELMEKLTSEGTIKIADMGDMITKVADSQKKIREAIKIIDQIAFQTNILSLNAAVEAASAGEHGKGFAVVATEVRNLAAKSTEASDQIKELVTSGSELVEGSMELSNDVTKSFDSLVESILETSNNIREIAEATNEQQVGISQISNTMNQLDSMTQENAAKTSEANEIANNTYMISASINKELEDKEYKGKK